MMWPVEIIPDEDSVYYRIHQTFIRDGELIPGGFKERGSEKARGMSTDWEKYSTPEESRNRAKKPTQNGIISFVVGNLREVKLRVIHAPTQNRAHTNVKGIDVETRLKLLDLFHWEIPFEGHEKEN